MNFVQAAAEQASSSADQPPVGNFNPPERQAPAEEQITNILDLQIGLRKNPDDGSIEITLPEKRISPECCRQAEELILKNAMRIIRWLAWLSFEHYRNGLEEDERESIKECLIEENLLVPPSPGGVLRAYVFLNEKNPELLREVSSYPQFPSIYIHDNFTNALEKFEKILTEPPASVDTLIDEFRTWMVKEVIPLDYLLYNRIARTTSRSTKEGYLIIGAVGLLLRAMQTNRLINPFTGLDDPSLRFLRVDRDGNPTETPVIIIEGHAR